MCVDSPAALALEPRASPASRRKSTMPASAAFCRPASAAVMGVPSAAAVLFARDMFEVDSNERLLQSDEE